ncbi:hypothetical protein [Streptomyces sp. 150FB]|uniref:WD40 repeat domain-containing protein n=1 Tax=Streptomyces sp. 150FB TaxID=1576605 RepID=UPI0013648DA3|nr:hypothetical protein [Streptomyces sp. 150FB]
MTVAAAVGVPLALNLTGDEDDGSLRFDAPDSESGVSDVVISPNGKILAGRCDEFVQLWDTRTRQSLGKLPVSNLSWVHTLAFSRDSRMVAAGTDDSVVHLWSTTTRRSLAVLEAKDTWGIKSIGIAPDGNRVYGNDGNVVWVWNRLDKQPSGSLRPTGPTGLELKYSALAPDGKTLAVACGNGTVSLMSTATRRETTRIVCESVITQLAFSTDGKILAGIGDREESVLLWDVPHAADKNPVIGSLTHTHSSPTALAFGSGGKTVAVAYDDDTIRLWGVSSRRVTKTITLSSDESATQGLAFSTDGAFLAVTRNGSGHLWNLR